MIFTPSDIDQDIREEVDVCIIGSGAGGAVLAKELSEGGRSVVVMEEGGYFQKEDFKGSALELMIELYRDAGVSAAIGRPSIPVALGKCIGGGTVINGGTSFRTPDKVLKRWQMEYGIHHISPEQMLPHFEKVEKALKVERLDEKILGGNNLALKRGTEALGYQGAPVQRNSGGKLCRAVCAFGCPDDVKQAMHITYIPWASEKGAKIYSRCRAERILSSGGRVTGVMGVFLDDHGMERKLKIEVTSGIVIVAAGGMHSPALLLANKLCNKTGQVGKHFMVHPCSKVTALFEEEINGWQDEIQGYHVKDFMDEGILIMPAFTPPELVALSLPGWGVEKEELMLQYNHLALIGALVSDTTRGRIWKGLRGEPLATYFIDRQGVEKCVRGIALCCEIMFAAGAKKVFPAIPHLPVIENPGDIRKLFELKIWASDLELVSLHAMGSCRMGENPKNSVVDSFGESHEIKNLFVCDSSILPSPLGVNPQITNFALADRTAQYILDNRTRYF